MTIFDQFFYSIFNHYKINYKQKANTIALWYTSVLQIAILFLLGSFFTVFSLQMNLATVSRERVWTFFTLIAICIHVKNWIKYNGKGRKILNAKLNKNKFSTYSLMLLFLLPFVSVALGLIILQAL